MLSETHPNAQWLSQLYRGGAAIAADPTLDEQERSRRLKAHEEEVMARMSPDMVIHTGGVRLAATGGKDFIAKYHKRRGMLSDVNVRPMEIDQILADDTYGIIHGTFQTVRGDHVWTRIGMGAWRFEDGVAVEHWELSNGPKWDEFFLGGDPGFEGTAEEFWTKDV